MAEIGTFTFVAEGAFVVEPIAEAEIGADLAEDFLFERKHIARDVGGVDFTRGAGLGGFGSEVGGGLEGGISSSGVTGDTDTGFIDVIQIVGVGQVVHDGKHSVAFLGSGAGAEGGAGRTLGIGVDGDDDDASASEFEGDIGLGFFGALESRHDNDRGCGGGAGGGKWAKEIGGNPLAVLGGEGNSGYLDLATRSLNLRSEGTGEYDNGYAGREEFETSGRRTGKLFHEIIHDGQGWEVIQGMSGGQDFRV